MFGNRPKRITKLEVFSTVIFVIIMFVMGYVSVMTTTHTEKPGWKTYRNGEPEPNGDMQKTTEIAISQLVPQTNITQFRILFDEAHYPGYYTGAGDGGIDNYYFMLYLEILSQGHVIDILNYPSRIYYETLSNYDLLVIPYTHNSYYYWEIDNIENWVRNGGNLLLLQNYYADELTNMMQRFGYEIYSDGIFDEDDHVGDNLYQFDGVNIGNHAITEGIQNVMVSEIQGIIKPAEADEIIRTDWDGSAIFYNTEQPAKGIPWMCAQDDIDNNGGRIVYVTANSLWDNYNYDNYYPHLYMGDNCQLAINTFNWLVDRNDTMKIDSDNDTLIDYRELYFLNSDPYSNDTDLDNLLDIFEYENGLSLNSNDTDNDNLSDFDEFYNLPTDPIRADTDRDLLKDGDEYFIYGTNATLKDTDIDGIPDGYEVFNLMNPLDETDAELDFDNDQLTNLEEYKYGGNVNNNDTDADGLLDYDELYIYYTKINRNDTDFDGLMDWDEIFIYFTDPRDRDTDDDNYSDRLEILEGWDPLDPDDPVPRPWVSSPRPTVQISISIFSILVIFPLISTAIYIRRKKK